MLMSKALLSKEVIYINYHPYLGEVHGKEKKHYIIINSWILIICLAASIYILNLHKRQQQFDAMIEFDESIFQGFIENADEQISPAEMLRLDDIYELFLERAGFNDVEYPHYSKELDTYAAEYYTGEKVK